MKSGGTIRSLGFSRRGYLHLRSVGCFDRRAVTGCVVCVGPDGRTVTINFDFDPHCICSIRIAAPPVACRRGLPDTVTGNLAAFAAIITHDAVGAVHGIESPVSANPPRTAGP